MLFGPATFDHKPMVERRVVVHPDEIGGFGRFQTIAQSAQSCQRSDDRSGAEVPLGLPRLAHPERDCQLASRWREGPRLQYSSLGSAQAPMSVLVVRCSQASMASSLAVASRR
jgi:hypothetical protein